MTQYNLPVFASPTPGRTFLKDNLEPWRDAVHSMHAGVTRPDYVVPQMMWIDTSATPWVLKVFQGSNDIVLGSLDPVTLNFTPSAVDGGTVTGMTAGNVSSLDPNSTGSLNVQGQLDYSTRTSTQAEAVAGTDNSGRMTPLRTKQSLDRFNDLPSADFSNISWPASGGQAIMLHDGYLVARRTGSTVIELSGRCVQQARGATGGSLGAFIPVVAGESVLLTFDGTASLLRNYKANRVS